MQRFNSDKLTSITHWLKLQVDRGDLPFAAWALTGPDARFGEGFIGQVADDSLFRIYSMTKPLASIAALRLMERGELHLDQPLSDFLPAFAEAVVVSDLTDRALPNQPANTPITLHHLFTHTSGLVYGLFEDNPLGAAYRRAKVDFAHGQGTLAEQVDRLAELPLMFEPGTRWKYGVSTDVLGRVIEVVTGQTLDVALAELVLTPLGMSDSHFLVPGAKADRLPPLYVRSGAGSLNEVDPAGQASSWVDPARVQCFSAGSGLVSTLRDYERFARCLLNGGAPLISRATLDYARQNHLPGDIASMGEPAFSEMPMTGVGFGLGFGIIDNPALARMNTSPGDYGWGGYASTVFWVDPVRRVSMIFMTQQIPSSALPIRPVLRNLVSAAVLD